MRQAVVSENQKIFRRDPAQMLRQEVRRDVMEGYQDAIYRQANEGYGSNKLFSEALFVNAKQTDFEDNCVDASMAEAMTIEEWKESPWGLPRSDKRDCKEGCQCLLYPVGKSGDKLAEHSTGVEYSR